MANKPFELKVKDGWWAHFRPSPGFAGDVGDLKVGFGGKKQRRLPEKPVGHLPALAVLPGVTGLRGLFGRLNEARHGIIRTHRRNRALHPRR